MNAGYQLVHPRDPILREYILEMDFLSPGLWDVRAVAKNLWLTMRAGAKGITGLGLAAPQCGIRLRMFVMNVRPLEKQTWASTTVAINPVILERRGPVVVGKEGCLTVPGQQWDVSRYEDIRVEYTDLTGKVRRETLYALAARVFQHELDHLNGQCIF